MSNQELIAKLKEKKIVAIVRGLPVETVLNVTKALYDGGIRFVEVTFNQSSSTCLEDTGNAIRAICEHYTDLHVGAGTVISEEQLMTAYNAGAKYIISPNMDTELIRKTKELGLLSMPGAMTASEIVTAYKAGADFVKLFPTDNLGAGYIKAVRAPLSHIPMLAVGGVNDENMADFYKAGACGFGIGGNIVNKKLVESGDFAGLTALARRYVAAAERL